MGCGASSPASGVSGATPSPRAPNTAETGAPAHGGGAAAGRSNPPPQGKGALQRAKSVKVSELVNRKLADPNLVLTPDERLDVMRECIGRGEAQAQTAAGKDLLVIIGNTGAGKSTCVNYVDGCTLQRVSLSDGGRGPKVVRVAPDSPRPELMRIGHTDKSQTFVPDVRPGHEFVYCDCPGFLDTRGAEINIANAVNIKATVSRAKSTKVLVLLNYKTLGAKRGGGLQELADILVPLFGSPEGLREHKVGRRSLTPGFRS